MPTSLAQFAIALDALRAAAVTRILRAVRMLFIAGIGLLAVGSAIALPPVAPSAAIRFTLAGSVDVPASLSELALGEQVQAIGLEIRQPGALRPQDPVEIVFGAGRQQALSVQRVTELGNGDRVVAARGAIDGVDVRLVLTFNEDSAHGHIESGDSVYRLVAADSEDGFRGWFYTPKGLPGQHLQNDYILIPRAESAAPVAHLGLRSLAALKLGHTVGDARADDADGSEAAARLDGVALEHDFVGRSLIRGETGVARVRIHNRSSAALRDVTLEIFFLAEEAQVALPDSDCAHAPSTAMQQVIRCGVAQLPAGATKEFLFDVRAQLGTPSTIQSSALLNGELRADASLRVVSDVRADSDLDGVSDFNERLMGTDAQDPASVDYAATTIDIVALYSPAAREKFPTGVETRINQLVAVANQVFADSGVGVTLRVVHHAPVQRDDRLDLDSTLDDLLQRRAPGFNTVDALRSSFGGDIALFFRPLEYAASRCGLAPVGGYRAAGDFSDEAERRNAVAVVAIDCPLDIVVAHEVGHLMGLTHSLREDGEGGTFEFATGHGVDRQFATVMALPSAFATEARVPKFSSPALRCGDSRCGIEEGEIGAADAVTALNAVRHQIGRFSDSVLAPLPVSSIDTLSGQRSEASIAIGASSDDRRSLSARVTALDLVSVIAEVRVDPRHIGRAGGMHVLLALGGSDSVYQLSSQGELTPWDGSVEGLTPFGGRLSLRSFEQLTIMHRLRLGDLLAGERLAVLVAYQVAGQGTAAVEEIVFPREPFWLTIEP